MQITLIIIASLATAFALPLGPKTAAAAPGSCTFSANERSNLGHNHDVNTGMILVNGKPVNSGIAIFGSGCSPAWAVGGAATDKSPTPTPKELMKSKINY